MFSERGGKMFLDLRIVVEDSRSYCWELQGLVGVLLLANASLKHQEKNTRLKIYSLEATYSLTPKHSPTFSCYAIKKMEHCKTFLSPDPRRALWSLPVSL